MKTLIGYIDTIYKKVLLYSLCIYVLAYGVDYYKIWNKISDADNYLSFHKKIDGCRLLTRKVGNNSLYFAINPKSSCFLFQNNNSDIKIGYFNAVNQTIVFYDLGILYTNEKEFEKIADCQVLLETPKLKKANNHLEKLKKYPLSTFDKIILSLQIFIEYNIITI